jgi:hypothetical protein
MWRRWVLPVLFATAALWSTKGIENRPGIHWMHIQKTSSWLGNFVLLWSCSQLRKSYPTKESTKHLSYAAVAKSIGDLRCEYGVYSEHSRSYGFHIPVRDNWNGSTVTVFRNPYMRVVSAFLFGNGDENIMLPIGFPHRNEVKSTVRERIRNSSVPIVEYANTPGIASCQTKMVLGKDCGFPMEISDAALQAAIQRMRQLAFVGLTEESEASARLFLAMHPIHPPISTDTTEIMVGLARSTVRVNREHTPERNKELTAALRNSGWRDNADETVYLEAVRLFYERCAQYKIQTKFKADQLVMLTRWV